MSVSSSVCFNTRNVIIIMLYNNNGNAVYVYEDDEIFTAVRVVSLVLPQNS